MKKQWIKYLCDPVDKSEIKLEKVFEFDGKRIIRGTLKSQSGNVYQIKEGIPILLDKRSQTLKSVESFGYEWNEFDYDYGQKSWMEDIIKPSVGSMDYFKNKIIVDCGAGSGRQSSWMAEAGAKLVVAVELSDSVHTAAKKATRHADNVFLIQADIAHLPLKKTAFYDLIYCVNVIQHTQNETKTLIELSSLMTKKSRMIFNIYLHQNRYFIIRLVGGLRQLTSELPYKTLKQSLYLPAVFIFILSKFRIVSIGRSFRETWLNMYDLFGGHSYQKFYTEEEVQRMISSARLIVEKRTKYVFVCARNLPKRRGKNI